MMPIYPWLLFVGLGLGSTQIARAADEAAALEAAARERASIEETHRFQSEILDARAQECRQRFATTRCLNQVSSERLKLQAQLKQREQVLNDAERYKRGLEETERNQEKAQARAKKMASLAPASETRASLPKPPPQPGGAPSTRSSPDTKSQLTDQQRSDNAGDYARKQAEAQVKRAEVAKRVAEKGVPKAPLPKPNS